MKKRDGNIFTSVFAATSGGFQKMYVHNGSMATTHFGSDVVRSDLFKSVLSTVDLSNDMDIEQKKLVFSIQQGYEYSGGKQVTVARPLWKNKVLTAGMITIILFSV